MSEYFDIAAFDIQDAAFDLVAPLMPAGWAWDLGRPGDVQNLHAWISTELDTDFPRVVSGGRQRDEEGRLFIRAQIVLETNDVTGPRDRARELARVVETAFASDPRLGGLVQQIRIVKAEGRHGVTKENTRALVYHLNLTAKYELSVALQSGA